MVTKSNNDKIKNSFIHGRNGKNSSESRAKKEFFIEAISKYCDRCGTPYSIDNVRIVQDSDKNSTTIIHFFCDNCLSNHIASFIKPLGLVNRVPIKSDLGSDELIKFIKQGSISADDVLSVYDYLSPDI